MSTHEPSYTDLAPGTEFGVPARPSVRGANQRANVNAGHARARALFETVKFQLATLLALAGALDLWALRRNGFANTYYGAAVRSMSSSWHDFLFASMDKAGVMTVDKPPLALWVQALSVRVFGYHPLSILVPQALFGMATVALVYDLVRRSFGKLGGFAAGLALALTPIAVAISRHNNPDALLVLCSVASVWCAVRALDPAAAAAAGRRRARWLALAGICVGLGFETKMGVALMVVPGIVAACLWVAPLGRLRALRDLGLFGIAALLVGGAWPLLVELTPASQRPWISGTKGNRIWELITEYNGIGRLEGQTGGPAGVGGGGNMFGGSTGPLRLLNSALGGQAGWLLGFALLSGIGVLLASRLRRGDPRSGWLIVVGGAFLVVAVVFSGAAGIFHPYYVSLLAPFAAALTGAGFAQLRGPGRLWRLLAPLAILAGVACQIVVIHDYPSELRWLVPVLIVVGAGAAIVLALLRDPAVRAAALGCGIAALLIAPAIWAVDTLGYATSSTFPSGGPQSALAGGGGPGGAGFGGRAQGGSPFGLGARGSGAPGGPAARAGAPGGSSGVVPLFGPAGARAVAGGGEGPPRPPGGGGAIGAPLGNESTISTAIAYAKSHGGGTVAVDSQSDAASEIVAKDADVAGIGGFSGRESEVSVAWLAGEVYKGAIRWVLSEGSAQGGPRLLGDTRQGAKRAIGAASAACKKVTLGASGDESALYDCAGRGQALLNTQAES